VEEVKPQTLPPVREEENLTLQHSADGEAEEFVGSLFGDQNQEDEGSSDMSASRTRPFLGEQNEPPVSVGSMYSNSRLPHLDPSIPTSVIMEAEPPAGNATGGMAPDFRPRRLRHPWAAYDRCFHEAFQSSPMAGCTCATGRMHHHQGELGDGAGLYQTPPPAHRSSMYPGSLPENTAARQNRLLRAVQRMNPAHQRIWQLQQNQQERLRRHMGSTRTAAAAPTSASSATVSGVAGEDRHLLTDGDTAGPSDDQRGNYQQGLLMENELAPADPPSVHATRDGHFSCTRPMLTVPRIVMGGRPAGAPPGHRSSGGVNLTGGVGGPPLPHMGGPAPVAPPPPPAHLHSHPQQRIFEDPSGRYRRYQHYLHRWHIPVMAEPPNVPFHHGFEDLQHPHPVQHYHNPWNPSSNIR
jgi:hypothetical protein